MGAITAWTVRARIVWGSVLLLGAAALVTAALRDLHGDAPTDGLTSYAVAAGLALLSVWLGSRPIEPAPHRKISGASAAAIAAALVLPAALAAVSMGLAGVVAQAIGRRRWYAVAFNAAQRVLAVLAAGAVCHAFQDVLGIPYMVPCIAAGAAYFAVNTGAVSAMAAARRGKHLLAEWGQVIQESWVIEVGLLTCGILIAIHLVHAPLVIPLLLAPLGLATKVMRDTAEIRRLNLKLSAALDRQRQFLADASHELRTPVASLRAQLDVLARQVANGTADSETSDVQRSVAQMSFETARVSGLLADLLMLARADEGAPLNRERVSVEGVLVSAYREARPLAQHVDFRLTLDDNSPNELYVTGDGERLRQLFSNLITNALRFTTHGGRVEIACEARDGEVRVRVEDTGCGIAETDLPHIFDRFYRADAGRARGADADGLGGSGLGLAIAKWIAEAHAGAISVRSEVGNGTVFTVTLPVAEPEARVAPATRRVAGAV